MQGKVGAILAPLGFGLLAIALLGAAGANAVTDSAPPALTLPAAATTNATTSQGALVSFIAVATDDVQPTSLICAPASGARFAPGVTTVTCTAMDAASHSTSASFAITVLGATDQLALLRAAVIALHLDPSVQQGLLDKLDSAKQSILAGQSRIACNQLDAFANQVKAQTKKAIADGTSLLNRQYDIEAALDCVQSKAAPVVLGPRSDVTTNTAPGLATATVRYTGPSCNPSSPAALALGTTRITCQATNTNGTTLASFNVTVLDREAPVLTLPSDIAVNAPAGSSTAAVSFVATAHDNVGVRSLTCNPASGSVFAHGPTTVTCIATDTSGNTASGSFTVTVNYAITGRITDADTGLPLAGVRAAVFDSITGERLDLTVSDADGRYSIVVPPGTYRVRFNGNLAVPYEIQLWHGKADNEVGDVISVTGSVGGIDAALKRVSFIRGHVSRQDGSPIEGVFVNANDGLAGCCHFITGSRTNTAGDFAIPVRPGTYKVLFFSRPGFLANDGVTYLDQWWNGAPFFEQGTPIVVGSADVGGINAVMTRAVIVSGHVNDASGLPVTGFQVNALDASVPCCQFVGGAQTDSHGDYSIAVPPGLTLKVDFGVFSGPPPGTRYVPQWWNNKSSFDAADSILATADVPNVNARLASGFLITGHVSERGSGAALAGIHVQVFDPAAPCCPFRQFAQTETSATGDYAVVLGAGSYRIQFSEFPQPAVRPHLSQWWQDKPFDQVADVLVIAGDRTGIDATLPVGVFISGSVTAAGGTVHVVGLNVSAQAASQPCCQFVGGAQTDAAGNYRFPVPAGSSVKVEFGVFSGSPPGTRYLGQWWDNKPDFGAANTINAVTDVSGINADLASGFVLSGHVSDASGTIPLATIGVNANDATLPCCQFIVGTQTDAAGNYRLIVPAGRVIRVFFSTNPAGGVRYLPEWWDDKPFFDQATDIAMTADRPGVDARLAPGVLIRGRVTDSTGTIPVAGLNVSAQDATQSCCHFVGGSQTDPNGQYSMVVPSGHDVKIEFGVFSGPPPGTRYLSEWWNNAPSFDAATPISTLTDQNNIDARLDQGFIISGQVRAPGGAGVPNVFVGASLGGTTPCCQGAGGTNTDATGHYRLVLPAGVYRINVSASPDRRLVMQWWAGVPGGTAYFQRAPDIALGPADATDRDFDVVFGTLIQGHVSDATNAAAIPGIGVTANDAAIACCEGLAFGGTDQQGNYFLVVPPGRQVRVFFSVGPGSPYTPQWWNNKASFDLADILDSTGDHAGIDARLPTAVLISGRVTDATGTNPVAGADVNLLDAAGPCCAFIGGAQTDAQGNYQIAVTPGRTVKVAFAVFGQGTPPGTRYLGQWWNNQQTFDTAIPINAAANVSGVDAHLATGFLVSGHVNDRDGHSLSGIHIQVIDPTVPCCPFREVAHTQTTATGDYAVVVRSGAYKVQFFEYPLPAEPHMNQWWQQKPFDQGADLLVVTGDRTGIDAFLDAARFVRGRVTDPAGSTGIRGVFVSAANASMSCCQFLAGAQTDEAGNYSFIVPRNTLIKVQFDPPGDAPYAREWWNDRSTFASADTLFMNTDQNGIDARLSAAFFITGRATEFGTGASLGGIQVVASDASLACCVDVAATLTTSSGDYLLRVSAGTYRVWFGDPTDRHLPQFWRNHSGGPEQADLVVVGPNQAGIDGVLIPAVTISGHVTDSTGSIVISGLNVSAQDATGPCCRFVGGAQVDVNGNYRIVVPMGSTVKVEFGVFSPPPPSSHLTGQWWNNKPTFETADAIAANADVPNINAQLAGAFTLSGRVTERGTGTPLRGIRVQPFAALGACCNEPPVGPGAVTDDHGDYSLNLPGGRYKLDFFEAPLGDPPHYFQWWSNKSTESDADVLVIFADTTGADAQLARAVFVNGQVTDAADGHPISGLQVSAQDATFACCRFIDGAQTDASGNYRFIAPLGASIKVEFGVFGGSPPGTQYVGEWWDNQPTFETATAILADANKTANAQLARFTGPTISGRVTDSARPGVGVEGISVTAQPAFGCCFYGATTDADGRYSINVTPGIYRVSFFAAFGSDLLEQWWNDKPGFSAADLITIPSSTVDLASISAVLIHGIPVRGTVTSAADGTPVGQVGVVATLDDPVIPCCVNYQAQSRPDGTYTMYVRAGHYRINFQPPNTTDFVGEYWDGQPDFGAATVLNVAGPTEHIDASLDRGFRVSGRVTDANGGAGVGGVFVGINDVICCTSAGFGFTGPDGAYSATVRAGNYTVAFNPPFGSDFVLQFWNGKLNLGAADHLLVDAAKPNIDAVLTHGIQVTGRITDAADPTIPLPGSSINALTAGDFQFVAFASADAGGNYTLFLPPGDYILWFNGPVGSDYGFEYWNDKADQASADVVHVAGPLSGMNVELSRSVRISGRVTDEAGHPIPGLFVNVDRSTLPFTFVNGGSTDADGRYSVLVRAGSYKVFFPSNGPSYVSEWWDDKTTFETATTIDVTASVGGIDAALASIDSSPPAGSGPPIDGTPPAGSSGPIDGTSGAGAAVADDRAMARGLTAEFFSQTLT